MLVLIILCIILILVGSSVVYYYSEVIGELKLELHRINGRIENVSESLEEFYEEQFVPIENYYKEHFQMNNVHEAEGS